MIVLIIVLIILIMIYLNIILTKEQFLEYSGDTIDSVTKEECILLVTKILYYLNKKHNKKLTIGNIDRVEKSYKNNMINYKINIFIYNIDKYTTKKIQFDITLNNNRIIINSIEKGNSRKIFEGKPGFASRGSTLLEIPNNSKNSIIPFNYTQLSNNVKIKNIKETNKEETIDSIKDRHSWILDKDAVKHKNESNFPHNHTTWNWDSDGIQYVYKTSDIKGMNHSYQKIDRTPNFFVSNFVLNDTKYEWMFDVSQDSASRPIGIGTAGT